MTPTVSEVEKAIKIPVGQWPFNCYAIACALVESGILKDKDAVAVYGHWLGDIHPESRFANRTDHGFITHGWVLMSDGTIIDPTRCVFENVEPYIFVGSPDDYDEGGNRLRALFQRPPPEFDPKKKLKGTVFFGTAERIVAALLGHEPLKGPERTEEQLFWLANLPYGSFAGKEYEVYSVLKKLNRGGYIPIDNWKRAEREARNE